MRTVPDVLTDTWLSGEMTGDSRPIARVTIQKLQIQISNLDPRRVFASALFAQGDIPQELPNVKSVEWERGIGSDVAGCTIIFYNTAPLPLGETPLETGEFDEPGYYTFNYGDPDFPGPSFPGPGWDQTPNKWQDYLIPDRVIRTYEGYGYDTTEVPENDPHLVQTGVWLIDEVEYGTDGLITVTCRDMGRLLIDHIMFPPVIPLGRYPIEWEQMHPVANPPKKSTSGTVFRPKYESDSNIPYVGVNGVVHGHRGSHAFDSSKNTFWMSIGNDRPEAPYSFEYIQGKTNNATVSGIKFTVWGGPYRVYASVKIGGKWQGRNLIPYDPSNPISAPNGADVKYVQAINVKKEGSSTFNFSTPYHNVQSVRLTFTHLYNSGIGPFKYRAGVRDFQVSSAVTTTRPGGTHLEGDYSDYTDIVKYLLACGGFYWPRNNTAFQTHTDGTRVLNIPTADDKFLTKGRVWADLMLAGTSGAVKLDVTIWDKKTLMDGIAYVRDILGFIFFVDEDGAAVFRLPNVYRVGNFRGNNQKDAGFDDDGDDIIVIDEKQTLLSLKAKLSSKDIREYIFVANVNGKIGAVAAGFNPVKPNPGLRRVGGWTDQNFAKDAECKSMAELITVRQMFQYRTDSLQITANPAIQIDDQVRIHERVTGEGYLHYVKSIKSSNDLEAGKWTYDLTTNWLGETPFTRWAFDQTKLSDATRYFLQAQLGSKGSWNSDGIE